MGAIKKVKASARHRRVRKYVLFALIFTFLFTINSLLFSTQQDEFQASLEERENIIAFNTSRSIDHHSGKVDSLSSASECYLESPESCENFVRDAIILRNRAEDYTVFLNDTLGISTESKQITSLQALRDQIENSMITIFGFGTKKSKELGIATPNDFITYFKKNTYNHKTDSSQSIEFEVSKINRKALTAFNYLDQYLDSLELKDSDIHDEIWKLRIRFYSLIGLEFLVFALVSLVDIINNRA